MESDVKSIAGNIEHVLGMLELLQHITFLFRRMQYYKTS